MKMQGKKLHNHNAQLTTGMQVYDEAHNAVTVAMYKPRASVRLTRYASDGTLGRASSASQTSA